MKSFGDMNPETNVTGNLGATCNGCHALSRDGLRMAINSDDDDSDDEYSDVTGSLIDMTTVMAIGGFRSQGPGFSSFFPDHTEYVTSNGLAQPPTNLFFLFDGDTAAKQTPASNLGSSTTRPTMPDWSPDGKTLLYVQPTVVGAWNNHGGAMISDDAHEFGGSLFTVPYLGNQTFGPPTPLLMSAGENNYYPGYSPDGKLIVFDRAPANTSVTTIDGCSGTPPHEICPNDSFSNPSARLMVLSTSPGAQPIDMELANGSPASAPIPTSNSWPKWSPFIQSYRGSLLLWVAFSSTRDYGLRVRNHQPGQYQCYPPDSFEDPGGAHGTPFDPLCQQPQLWMAAINISTAEGLGGIGDPSNVAFWLPFQDMTTHNHTPQWTQTVANTPPPDAGTMCIPTGGNCQTNPNGCCSPNLCLGTGQCGTLPQ